MTEFRLPPEPEIGTVVRPEPDTGERYTRHPSLPGYLRGVWRLSNNAWMYRWIDVLSSHRVLVAVDPEREEKP